MRNMTRHELMEATPWSAAVAGGVIAIGFTRLKPEMAAADMPLVLFLGAIGVAPLLTTTRDRAPTLNDRAGAWLERVAMAAILGAIYGAVAAFPVALLLGGLVHGLLDVELPLNALSNVAGVGALVPPAIRYFRLPVGHNDERKSQ